MLTSIFSSPTNYCIIQSLWKQEVVLEKKTFQISHSWWQFFMFNSATGRQNCLPLCVGNAQKIFQYKLTLTLSSIYAMVEITIQGSVGKRRIRVYTCVYEHIFLFVWNYLYKLLFLLHICACIKVSTYFYRLHICVNLCTKGHKHRLL